MVPHDVAGTNADVVSRWGDWLMFKDAVFYLLKVMQQGPRTGAAALRAVPIALIVPAHVAPAPQLY